MGEDSRKMAWGKVMDKMKINPAQKSYVCIHVFREERPVLLVSRAGGDWCFLCGETHNDSASEYRVVGIGHLFERDLSLLALADLLPEWEAERKSLTDLWIRTSCKAEDA